MNFEGCLKTENFNLNPYSQRQRIPLILRVLLQDLFSAKIDTWVSYDSNINQCCKAFAQLVID